MARIVLALALTGASALVTKVLPSSARRAASSALKMDFDVTTMEGVQRPIGFFDPFGLSKTSPQALSWYRACEVKHGRVAMLACTGFIVQGAGITLPGSLAISSLYPNNPLFATDQTFASLGKEPLAAWAAIPDLGKWQIVSTIFCLELYAESQKPHYMKGGPIGKIPLLWDPVGCIMRGKPITDTMSEEVLASKRSSELSNGRLAMIGAMGFSCAALLDGSVPMLPNGF